MVAQGAKIAQSCHTDCKLIREAGRGLRHGGRNTSLVTFSMNTDGLDDYDDDH